MITTPPAPSTRTEAGEENLPVRQEAPYRTAPEQVALRARPQPFHDLSEQADNRLAQLDLLLRRFDVLSERNELRVEPLPTEERVSTAGVGRVWGETRTVWREIGGHRESE